MNEIEVAVLCHHRDGSKVLFRCSVEATPEQVRNRYHYSRAEKDAVAYGFLYPMFAFSSDDTVWEQLEMKSTPKPIATKQNGPKMSVWMNIVFTLVALASVYPAWQAGRWFAEALWEAFKSQ